jgi:hypothetical protein
MNLKAVDTTIPFRAVHASRGKAIRAEPISALYEQGRVHHFGTFPELEDQMCDWVPGAEKSPDRIDALVYALKMLNLNAYVGSDFDIPVFDVPSSQEIGYSVASTEGFEDIGTEENYF